MTTDLRMLVASAMLTAVLVAGKGVAMWIHWPVTEVLGNRDDPPALPPWAWRADRAHRNMLENFPHFAALVIAAQLAGLSNWQTALGATIFFWARLAHAIVYVSGVWRLRAPVFFIAVGGELLVLARLLPDLW
ncbi:MAG TPA: MAPEG family protein [Candidatus Binatia bacterium]|jgi:uncharacterized MAPEG superfamily protein